MPQIAPENLVLLHGFAGTRRAWDGVIAALEGERYRPALALDLPGHGDAADAQRPITVAGCVTHVLAGAPSRFVLCGYSLGGRVALHVALAAPERVSRLVLVSSSPGLDDPAERAQRREADHRLAQELEERSFEDFIARWRGQPLFADEPSAVRRLAVEDHRRNDPLALAAALRGAGTAEMEPAWERLGELSMPVTFVAGRRDAKFAAIGERMARGCPNCRLVVVEGGHGLILENPPAIAAAIDGPAPPPTV
jgi:2-succinyl-6-hydroxy-2,4-cyclohexadiene-1-carboxylate synthase